jgi:4-diphosphocytidyl-2-C-methyl-D-erythritol kinase
MIFKSYAKINLFLEVLGKNEKNYHILESLICFLDICDQIEIKKSAKLSLKFGGEFADFLKNDKNENIILKTVKFMAEKFNFEPNLEIFLEKNIPIGAGIGGGSSNCATIILALNEIFQLNLNKTQLFEIGLKIGCDVPICLNKKMALVEGVGEKITEIELKNEPLFALIVNPNKFLSTREVFENWAKNKSEITAKSASSDNSVLDFIKNRRNDLEIPAQKIIPEITLILAEMQKQKNCLLSRMTGSGATCFGLFENENDLNLAYKNFQNKFPQFYLKNSRLIYEKI